MPAADLEITRRLRRFSCCEHVPMPGVQLRRRSDQELGRAPVCTLVPHAARPIYESRAIKYARQAGLLEGVGRSELAPPASLVSAAMADNLSMGMDAVWPGDGFGSRMNAGCRP